MPVTWLSTGTRIGANHRGSSLSTELNMQASPMPRSTRAT